MARDKTIMFLVTDEERRQIRAAAYVLGYITVSEMLRETAEAKVAEAQQRTPVFDQMIALANKEDVR